MKERKGILLFIFALVIFSCNLIDEKNEVTPHKLKSLSVNGDEISLKSGEYNYRYFLTSSDGVTSNFSIEAVAVSDEASVSGAGEKTVDNPVVITDPYSSTYYQDSTETNFTVEVIVGGNTTNYTITISSAPFWVKAPMEITGNGAELDGKKVRLKIWNPEVGKSVYSSVSLKAAKSQNIAFPLGTEVNCFVSNWFSLFIDIDGNKKSNKGDYLNWTNNVDINISKGKIIELPITNLVKCNQVEIINMPDEIKHSIIDWRDAYIFYRDINTGEYIEVGDWDTGDDKYIFHEPVLGTYEILAVGYDNGISPDTKVLNLGIHTLTETTDLVLDGAEFTIKTYSELGPMVLHVTNTSLYTTDFIFSEAMEKSTVEDALKIYNAEKFYAGEADAVVDITQYVWSNDDKTLTVNHLLNSDTLYLYKVTNKAATLNGEKIYFEFNIRMMH